MIKLLDGSIWLAKGEKVPYVCPCCVEPIAFNPFMAMVRCTNCKFFSFHEDFASYAVSYQLPE